VLIELLVVVLIELLVEVLDEVLVEVLDEVLVEFESVVVERALVLVAVGATGGSDVPGVLSTVPVGSEGEPGSVTADAVNGGLDATSDSSEPPPLTNVATTPDMASVAAATQVHTGRKATRRCHHDSAGVRHSSGRAGQG
jgi:hypothetical protein